MYKDLFKKYIYETQHYYYLFDLLFLNSKKQKLKTLIVWGVNPSLYRKNRLKKNSHRSTVDVLLDNFNYHDLSTEEYIYFELIYINIFEDIYQLNVKKIFKALEILEKEKIKKIVIEPLIILMIVLIEIILIYDGYKLIIDKKDIEYLLNCNIKYFDGIFEILYLLFLLFINISEELIIKIETLLLIYPNVSWIYYEILTQKTKCKISYYYELLNTYNNSSIKRYLIIIHEIASYYNLNFMFNRTLGLLSKTISYLYLHKNNFVLSILNEYFYALMMLKKIDCIIYYSKFISDYSDDFLNFCVRLANKEEVNKENLKINEKYTDYVKNILKIY